MRGFTAVISNDWRSASYE